MNLKKYLKPHGRNRSPQATSPSVSPLPGKDARAFVHSPATNITYLIGEKLHGVDGQQSCGIYEVTKEDRNEVHIKEGQEQAKWALKLFYHEKEGPFHQEKQRFKHMDELREAAKGRFPYIIHAKDKFEDAASGMGCIVMPLAKESLTSRIESGKYTLVEASVWLWQLACALCALRNASIVHMDIKADNILLMPGKNGIDDLLLADFGVGKDVPAGGASAAGELPPMEQEHISFEMKNLVNNYVHKSLVGRLEGSNVSPATIAEIEGDFAIAMSQYVIDESADMWSFGVLGLELLDKASSLDYSAMELSQENDICKTIKSKLQKSLEAENHFDQGIFDAICNVVAAALNPRPTKRSTPQKTLEMFELQDTFWSGLMAASGVDGVQISSALLASGSDFVNISIDNDTKRGLIVAFYHDMKKSAGDNLLFPCLCASSPSLRLKLVGLIVDMMFFNQQQQRPSEKEAGVKHDIESSRSNAIQKRFLDEINSLSSSNLKKLLNNPKSFQDEPLLKNLEENKSVVQVLLSLMDPMIPGSKTNVMFVLTLVYVHFGDGIADVPSYLCQMLANTTNAMTPMSMPSSTILENVKFAIVCLQLCGPKAILKNGGLLHLVNLYIADQDRLIIEHDVYVSIKTMLWDLIRSVRLHTAPNPYFLASSPESQTAQAATSLSPEEINAAADRRKEAYQIIYANAFSRHVVRWLGTFVLLFGIIGEQILMLGRVPYDEHVSLLIVMSLGIYLVIYSFFRIRKYPKAYGGMVGSFAVSAILSLLWCVFKTDVFKAAGRAKRGIY